MNKRYLQIGLLIAVALVGLRLFFIYRSRNQEWVNPRQPEKSTPLTADQYVIPKRLRAYDLQSAKELIGKPAWARDGYRYSYYPHSGRTDWKRPAGQLQPIEKITAKNIVIETSAPASTKTEEMTDSTGKTIRVRTATPTQKQMSIVFDKEGKTYSVPVGVVEGDDYSIYIDEIFFIQDPRELYKHWPEDVWAAIGRGEVVPGMNELQTSFAIGMGIPQSSEGNSRVVKYPHGGKPIMVTYENDRVKAADAQSEEAAAVQAQ